MRILIGIPLFVGIWLYAHGGEVWNILVVASQTRGWSVASDLQVTGMQCWATGKGSNAPKSTCSVSFQPVRGTEPARDYTLHLINLDDTPSRMMRSLSDPAVVAPDIALRQLPAQVRWMQWQFLILFGTGAVVLAVALIRMRRRSVRSPAPAPAADAARYVLAEPRPPVPPPPSVAIPPTRPPVPLPPGVTIAPVTAPVRAPSRGFAAGEPVRPVFGRRRPQ